MEMKFEIGQEVYYMVRGGWGGGETLKLSATIEKLQGKSATISLWNTRYKRKDFKTVRLTSLAAR